MAFEDGNSPQPDGSVATEPRLRAGCTLAAFCFGSVALLLASIPLASILTKPLSAAGLVLGLLAGAAAARQKPLSLTCPLAVSALCLTVLLFAGSWPALHSPPQSPAVAIPFRQGGMVANQPIGEDDWVDASVNSVQRNDLRVQILSVRVGAVELRSGGHKAFSPDRYLAIRLRVSYHGIDFQQLPYEPWSDRAGSPSKHPPTLIDDRERTYPQKAFDRAWTLAGRADRGALTPGRGINEVLIFAAPGADVEYLRLALPAAAFGAAGEFRFQIPRSMLAFS